MKTIQKILIAAAATVFAAQGLYAQVSPFVVSKTVTDNGNGNYTLTLKSHMTGDYYDAKSGPADIVFLMDVSKNLTGKITDDNLFTQVSKAVKANPAAITSTVKTAMTGTTKNKFTATAKNPTVVRRAMTKLDRTTVTTKNWTYKSVTYGNAAGTDSYSKYYRDANGDYYVVHRADNLTNTQTGANNVRALWYVDKNGDTRYLTSTGVSDTYQNVTSNSATIWNGTLYTGWTYLSHYTTSTNSDGSSSRTYQCYGFHYGNADATHENQRYYLHTDGEYYPVRMRNDMPDAFGGNSARVGYVIIDGVIWYLRGDKLDTDYDHEMTSDYRAIYFAPLYYSKSDGGGWAYENIVAATASGGHYYKFSDGRYYPVRKEDLGSGNNRYQAFILVDGVKWYLYGTHQLSATPCPFSAGTKVPFFFGELYTGGWCTSNITDGSTGPAHYYLHTDGEYYPVREIAVSGNHQAYIELPDGKHYFNGNGIFDTPDIQYDYSTTKYVALYFGNLYTVTGWSQAGVTAATAGAGHYWQDTATGYYYPVLKETLGPATTPSTPATTYQLYVEVPENGTTVKRYLWGHSIHADPCPYSAGTATVIWYGTLYKGGWSQNTITINDSSHQGYSYLHTDGEYYPIYRENKNVDDNGNIVTSGGTVTYQNYVILPDGNHWYLCGNEISLKPYKYSVKKNSSNLGTVSNWFGPLYSGAWTYANILQGNRDAGYFYLHENGKYYPVLKEDRSSSTDAAGRYQVYVNVPEGKRYLYGTGLSSDPYPASKRTNVAIYYGALYTGGWTQKAITSGTHFYRYGDTYYRVEKETLTSSYTQYKRYRYQLYIGNDLDGNPFPLSGRWYLAGSEITDTPYTYTGVATAADATDQTTAATLYFLPLYQLKDNVKSVGLQNAVSGFIDEMAAISQQSGINHRIALAQFGNTRWAYTTTAANYNDVTKPHLSTANNSVAANQSAALLADFADLSQTGDVSNLHTAISQEIESTGNSVTATAHRFGFSLAYGLFRREGGYDESGTTAGYNYDDTGGIQAHEKSLLYGSKHVTDAQQEAYSARRKVVIVIGDGVERTWNPDNQDLATEWATRLKNLSQDPDDKAEIYYVQVNSGTDPNYDYEAVTEFNKQLATDDDHFIHVEKYDENLTAALLGIAGKLGGTVVPVGTDAVVQDVVAPEFTVPSNAQVQLFTADYIGEDAFDEESAWTPFTGTVTRTDNPDGTTTMRVTGFDFSANKCGVIGSGDDLEYSGKQLIVQIPIQLKEIVVGGAIPTNTSDSKLLDAQQNTLAAYPIPTIDGIVVHLQVSKSGLKEGESAIFTVWRKALTDPGYVTTGTPVLKFILTGNAEGTPVVADIVGLDPNYHYLVRDETSWSWTYAPDVTSISTEDWTLNPLIFVNTPKNGILYDAGEAEVNNVW